MSYTYVQLEPVTTLHIQQYDNTMSCENAKINNVAASDLENDN